MAAELTPALLAQITSAVLEEVAFVFTEPSERPSSYDGDWVQVSLAFSGPRRGRMSMAAPRVFGAQVASTIAGDDGAQGPEALERGDDALREILNIVAGRLLGEWLGTEAVYEIGIPERSVTSAAEHESAGLRARALCAAALVTDEDVPIELAITASD